MERNPVRLSGICAAVLFVAPAAVRLAALQAKPAFDLKASAARGRMVYDSTCVTCHQKNGEGVQGVYPPLAKADYLMANKTRAIGIVVNGTQGTITVNGTKYESEMVAVDLKD